MSDSHSSDVVSAQNPAGQEEIEEQCQCDTGEASRDGGTSSDRLHEPDDEYDGMPNTVYPTAESVRIS